MKLGALILGYRQIDYIEYCINAIRPFVDRIVVMHSDLPWTKYNANSRSEFGGDDGTKEVLYRLAKRCLKLNIIEGIWDIEEDMRNEGVEWLERMDLDWLLVVDADEFYPDGTLTKLRKEVTSNSQQYSKGCLWAGRINHYRRFDYIIDQKLEGWDRIEVLFKLKGGIKFVDRRIVGAPRIDLPESFYFHHFGFVLSDDRMWEKLHTWGHAHEVLPCWYRSKWKEWMPETRGLCKRVPGRWAATRKFDIEKLPTVLHDHPFFGAIRGGVD